MKVKIVEASRTENRKTSLSPKDYAKRKKALYIAFDFDGTITTESKYPEVGVIDEVTVELIHEIQSRGHKVILWTCRDGEKLQEALDACKACSIEFDDVNGNKFAPFARGKKIFYNYLLDDRACGYAYAYSLLCKIGVKKFVDYLEDGVV